MTPNKVRRCRRIINAPGYWRDRAIAEGERYGALEAETNIITSACRPSRFRDTPFKEIVREQLRASRRLMWYAEKAAHEEDMRRK